MERLRRILGHTTYVMVMRYVHLDKGDLGKDFDERSRSRRAWVNSMLYVLESAIKFERMFATTAVSVSGINSPPTKPGETAPEESSSPGVTDTLVAGTGDVRPPSPPWREIAIRRPPTGYLSFYIADDLSRLPVRAVTLPGNNKADPNLETATYGLFSTCERLMRAGIVARGIEYIFFLTNPKSAGRRLTGYYRLRWYYEHARGDFAVAATEQHFVMPALSPSDLFPALRSLVFSHFRGYKSVDAEATAALLEALHARPDATTDYLGEIDRLERFNAYHTGNRHWNSKQPFSWEVARGYLRTGIEPAAKSNVSPTNQWRCKQCSAVVYNRALLRSCPHCQGLGTLEPMIVEG
jgi:hypothetical protein